MIAVIAAIIAGALAAVVRFLVTRTLTVPWGVLVVNVVGSGIGGAVLALAIRGDVSSDIRLVLLGGLCGGLTTFSTFSVDTVELAMNGRWTTAVASVAANLLLGVGAAALACAIVLGV